MVFGAKGHERENFHILDAAKNGVHYSEQIIEPILDALKLEAKGLLLTHETAGDVHSGPPLSQFASRALLVEAFRTLPDWLATLLQSAVHDTSRWHLTHVPRDSAGGYCVPREDADGRAVIFYRFCGALDDAIYMAHELGHLVSDDLFNAAGFNHLEAPKHVVEIPAFFTQHLMYDYLRHHGPYEFRAAALVHLRREMREQLIDIAIGASARDAEKVKDQAAGAVEASFKATIQSWLGEKWKSSARAVQIADRIADPSIRAETEEVFLHKHATASILAAALYAKQKVLSPGTRAELLATMFGRTGPYKADELLQIINISDGPELADLVSEVTRLLYSGPKQLSDRTSGIAMTDLHLEVGN